MANYTGTSIVNGDGDIFVDNGGAWATVHALGTGSPMPTTSPVNIYASKLASSSIGRGFIPFDKSNIGGGSVTSGSLVINITQVFSANGTIHLVLGNQASGGTLVSSDFGSPTLGIGNSGGSLPITASGLGTIVLN